MEVPLTFVVVGRGNPYTSLPDLSESDEKQGFQACFCKVYIWQFCRFRVTKKGLGSRGLNQKSIQNLIPIFFAFYHYLTLSEAKQSKNTEFFVNFCSHFSCCLTHDCLVCALSAQMVFRRPWPCNCRYTLFLFFSLKPTKLPIQRHQKQQNRLRIQGYRRKKERKNQFFWKMPETAHVGLTWRRVEQPEIRERTSNFRKLSWTNVSIRLKKSLSFKHHTSF